MLRIQHIYIYQGLFSIFNLKYPGNIVLAFDGHNGHKPERRKPKRPQTETAINRNGHRPERPQTKAATNRNGHRPERPQTEMATNRNGHKPERPQTGTATNKNILYLIQRATNLCAQYKIQTSVAISSKVTLSNIGTRLWYSYMNGHVRFHMYMG